MHDGRNRVIIENIRPQIDGGRFPIKRVLGEKVTVRADIFADGHDSVSAVVLYRGPHDASWKEVRMTRVINDEWAADFVVGENGIYRYTIEAWIDRFETWQKDLRKRHEAKQDLKVQFQVGAIFVEEAAKLATKSDKVRLAEAVEQLRTGSNGTELALSEELGRLVHKYDQRKNKTRVDKELDVVVEHPKALFSTWYERFPRSSSSVPGKHGTFKECIALLPEISRMGFDTWYLPPIHPIGYEKRKGKNNSPTSLPGDVGSPWAIGSKEGGHKSIHPDLGTMEDFLELVQKAREYGIDIALDMAFQCAPDHPYVKEHPEWFTWLPDGSVAHAENPPKKYEDILPLNFESEHWKELWEELRSVVLFWADKGIRVFRVDNPHTKPFSFWEWLIKECKEKHPEITFLSEAFTRPSVMYYLAKIGFTQSYTYFTWRNTKPEFTDYITHLLNTHVREFFRPNFWPNTPDILPEHLQYGGRPAFMMRFALAATLSASYGIYGPAFELCIAEAVPGKEEYLNSEKYELKSWDWDQPGNLKDFIARINRIRREHPALQTTWNLRFYEVDNEYLLFYGKATDDLADIILVVVNLDPYHTQSGWLTVPIHELGIPPDQPYLAEELLSNAKYIWHAERNYVEINPGNSPAQIFHLKRKMKRETDFDYYL